jgi:hypothetical protein
VFQKGKQFLLNIHCMMVCPCIYGFWLLL